MVDLPPLTRLNPSSVYFLNLPQLELRAWAGRYGEKHGFTKRRETDDPRPEFEETSEQDVFRHVFIAAAEYIARYEATVNALRPTGRPDALIAKLADQFSAPSPLRKGFVNEAMADNPLGHHLQDYWNNYEGVLVAREIVRDIGASMSNDALATLIAKEIRLNPERFIFDPKQDARTVHYEQFYEQRRLPSNTELFGRKLLVPKKIKEAFPEKYREGVSLGHESNQTIRTLGSAVDQIGKRKIRNQGFLDNGEGEGEEAINSQDRGSVLAEKERVGDAPKRGGSATSQRVSLFEKIDPDSPHYDLSTHIAVHTDLYRQAREAERSEPHGSYKHLPHGRLLMTTAEREGEWTGLGLSVPVVEKRRPTRAERLASLNAMHGERLRRTAGTPQQQSAQQDFIAAYMALKQD